MRIHLRSRVVSSQGIRWHESKNRHEHLSHRRLREYRRRFGVLLGVYEYNPQRSRPGSILELWFADDHGLGLNVPGRRTIHSKGASHFISLRGGKERLCDVLDSVDEQQQRHAPRHLRPRCFCGLIPLHLRRYRLYLHAVVRLDLWVFRQGRSLSPSQREPLPANSVSIEQRNQCPYNRAGQAKQIHAGIAKSDVAIPNPNATGKFILTINLVPEGITRTWVHPSFRGENAVKPDKEL